MSVLNNFFQLYHHLISIPGFAEELVLDEDCKGEHHNSLDGHSTEVFPHHFPAQWVLKTVFP